MKPREPGLKRNTAVLYPCGTCNLKCHYCGIDKNPILAKIDDALGESFKGDYYINQFRKYFPDSYSLKRIETWGGEPFLKMERVHHILNQVIQEYPYFEEMFSSTNFSYPEWPDKFFGLMKQFEAYAPRKFEYSLQLSLDGPTEINDFNRGEGVTEKCRANFEILLKRLPLELPDNVTLNIFFKPTLDNTSIKKLDTKEKIIDYYKFFEEWYEKLYAIKVPNVRPALAIPNTAVPSPVTKEDGKLFAQLCKHCMEIENENAEKQIFQYYKRITPYAKEQRQCPYAQYSVRHYVCGSGSTLIGFMPNGLISTCHEGFTHFYEDYKKAALTSPRLLEGATINFDAFINEQGSKYCLSPEQYEDYEKFMAQYVAPGTTARLVNITGLIMALAMADQIDRKYRDEYEANLAAVFIQNHTPYCIKDNYNTTGSFITIPMGLLKLLLNGAKEVIEELEDQRSYRGPNFDKDRICEFETQEECCYG